MMFQISDLFAVSFGVAVGLVVGAGILAARGATHSIRASHAPRRHRPRAVDRTRRSTRNPATSPSTGDRFRRPPIAARECGVPRPDDDLSASSGSDGPDSMSPRRAGTGRPDRRPRAPPARRRTA